MADDMVNKNGDSVPVDDTDGNVYAFLNNFNLFEEEPAPYQEEVEEPVFQAEEYMTADDVLDAINAAPNYLGVSLNIGDEPDAEETVMEEASVRVERRHESYLSVEVSGEGVWQVFDKLNVWGSLADDYLRKESDDPSPDVYFSILPYSIANEMGLACMDPLFWAMTAKDRTSYADTLILLFPGDNIGVFAQDTEAIREEQEEQIAHARGLPDNDEKAGQSLDDSEGGGFAVHADRRQNEKIYGKAGAEEGDVEANGYEWLG